MRTMSIAGSFHTHMPRADARAIVLANGRREPAGKGFSGPGRHRVRYRTAVRSPVVIVLAANLIVEGQHAAVLEQDTAGVAAVRVRRVVDQDKMLLPVKFSLRIPYHTAHTFRRRNPATGRQQHAPIG